MLARGQHISAITAINCDCLVEVDYAIGTVNADIFFDFVRGSLLPNLQPFDGTSKRSVVICDNCSIHSVDNITTLFAEAGVVLFRPLLL